MTDLCWKGLHTLALNPGQVVVGTMQLSRLSSSPLKFDSLIDWSIVVWLIGLLIEWFIKLFITIVIRLMGLLIDWFIKLLKMSCFIVCHFIDWFLKVFIIIVIWLMGILIDWFLKLFVSLLQLSFDWMIYILKMSCFIVCHLIEWLDGWNVIFLLKCRLVKKCRLLVENVVFQFTWECPGLSAAWPSVRLETRSGEEPPTLQGWKNTTVRLTSD